MSLLITLAISLVIGYLGPFNTYQMPWLQRTMYWVILIFAGHFIYSQVDRFIHWYFQEKKPNKILAFIVPSMIGAAILSFVVEYVSYVFVGRPLAFPENFLFFYPKVFILGLALESFGKITELARNNNQLQSEPQDKRPVERQAKRQDKPIETSNKYQDFLNRIPDKLGDELVCFCMEDHYLQVYTTQGNHMMLMRMKDALLELQDYHGLQVHRSWWVAIDEVVDAKKFSRKATLTMSNDMQVPVSQKYLPALKEVGIID